MDAGKTGQLIRELRKERNLSQDDLGEIVHVTRQAVSNWEVGKAIPDSDILLALSDLFDISIKELLLGERNQPQEIENIEEEPVEEPVEQDENQVEEPQEIDEKFLSISKELLEEYSQEFLGNKQQDATNESKELENIALDLVDKYNTKSRILKKTSIILISTIILLLLIFLIYYFITSYNTIQVFKISGDGEHFYTRNGVMINTKQKSYIRLGRLENSENLTIDKVKLYYYDKNKKKQFLYKDNLTDILLTDYYGYNEFYKYEDLEYIKNNLYIDIEYDNKKETIKLKITKDFANDNLFNRKLDKSAEKYKLNDNNEDYLKSVIKALEEKGKKINNSIKYEVEDNEQNISFYYKSGILGISIHSAEIEEIFSITLNSDAIINYNKNENSKEIDHIILKMRNKNKFSKKENEIYQKILYYLNNYLLNQ